MQQLNSLLPMAKATTGRYVSLTELQLCMRRGETSTHLPNPLMAIFPTICLLRITECPLFVIELQKLSLT